jgi:transposase
MIKAAKTVKRHWDGILRWFDSKIANGLIEVSKTGQSGTPKRLKPAPENARKRHSKTGQSGT